MSYQAKGLQAWFFQRVTGLFMAFYTLYVLWFVLSTEVVSYQIWLAWFSHPLMNAATGLFFIQLAVHAWVGMRDIALDYMTNDTLRFLTLTFISFFLIMLSLETIRTLFLLSVNV